jgi:hypothetical protein
VNYEKLTAAALTFTFAVGAVGRERHHPHVPDGGPPLPANGTRDFNFAGTATMRHLYTAPRYRGGSVFAG